MRTLQKTFLLAALMAIPFAGAQAQSQNTSSSSSGEMLESSKPDKNPTPAKSPNTTTPPASGTAHGEAVHSTVPGTDKPATTNVPNAPLHGKDATSSHSTPSTTGTPQQTAPSGESPPRAAPMRSGAEANSNAGTGTTLGTEKKQ